MMSIKLLSIWICMCHCATGYVVPTRQSAKFCLFAYGNWAMESEMRQYAQTAKKICNGEALEHRLDFNVLSDSFAGGYPTLVPDKGYTAFGVAYQISMDELETVKIAAGVIEDKEAYQLRAVIIQPENGEKFKCNAFMQVHAPDRLIYGLALPAYRRPTQKSLDSIVQSYIDAGFPSSYVDQVAELPTASEDAGNNPDFEVISVESDQENQLNAWWRNLGYDDSHQENNYSSSIINKDQIPQSGGYSETRALNGGSERNVNVREQISGYLGGYVPYNNFKINPFGNNDDTTNNEVDVQSSDSYQKYVYSSSSAGNGVTAQSGSYAFANSGQGSGYKGNVYSMNETPVNTISYESEDVAEVNHEDILNNMVKEVLYGNLYTSYFNGQKEDINITVEGENFPDNKEIQTPPEDECEGESESSSSSEESGEECDEESNQGQEHIEEENMQIDQPDELGYTVAENTVNEVKTREEQTRTEKVTITGDDDYFAQIAEEDTQIDQSGKLECTVVENTVNEMEAYEEHTKIEQETASGDDEYLTETEEEKPIELTGDLENEVPEEAVSEVKAAEKEAEDEKDTVCEDAEYLAQSSNSETVSSSIIEQNEYSDDFLSSMVTQTQTIFQTVKTMEIVSSDVNVEEQEVDS